MKKNIIYFVFVSFFIFIFYVRKSNYMAKENSVEFCSQISLNDSLRSLELKINQSQADKKHSIPYKLDSTHTIAFVTFSGFFPFSRYMCVLKFENDKIIKKSINNLE